jgi:hypothetical protein
VLDLDVREQDEDRDSQPFFAGRPRALSLQSYAFGDMRMSTIATGEIRGASALPRWPHGLGSP